ncbi:hypothetical protein NE619_18065 [Anaerovorax odorimutans]|uniref:Uncharacterized protein n=1 Tax=Anaerovorax odorimutans TaxID=109327 RepID=A0ABT1RTZ2_9FIRM|nr:hypothetical protein [Anaerovorax odorimutans]MCQ4638635.1 hypothetical protein [Anaerovorax odorimutans]
MPYAAMISIGLLFLLMLFSFLFKIAGKLRLTVPLVYFLLAATFLNKWAAAHEPLAFAILYGLIALSVLSWLFSLKRTLQERRYYRAMEDDVSWQIARAREKGISMEDVYFDSHGDMRYKDTNEPVI